MLIIFMQQYGGRGTNSLPQTLMFDHVSPATRLLEKRRQMFEVQEALNSQKVRYYHHFLKIFLLTQLIYE